MKSDNILFKDFETQEKFIESLKVDQWVILFNGGIAFSGKVKSISKNSRRIVVKITWDIERGEKKSFEHVATNKSEKKYLIPHSKANESFILHSFQVRKVYREISNFAQACSKLAQHHIGDQTINLGELERAAEGLKYRKEQWEKELEK